MRLRATAIELLTLVCASGLVNGLSTHLLARAQDAAENGAQSATPAATRLTSIDVGANDEGIIVTLHGNGRLVYSAIQEADRPPARLVIDVQGVRPDLPPATKGLGILRRVRVALNNPDPLITRVVLDLERMVSRHLRPSADGRELAITLEAPAPSETDATAAPTTPPVDALRSRSAPTTPVPAEPEPVASANEVNPALPLRGEEGARGQGGGPGGKGFTGHPVSLDFQGVDLRAVLRTFSEITGLNVVIDPGVKGSVDVSLREVPWDQALDIILRANQLGYSVEGRIVRIAPLDVLASEEASRRRLKEEQDLSGEIVTLTRALSYAKAQELTPLLLKTSLTRRGNIQVDERTNTIILTDLRDGLDRATRLIETLDTPQPQVEIEARIIETRASYRKELGIRLGLTGAITPALGNTLPLTFPNQGTIDAGTGSINQNAPTVVGVTLGSINGAFGIDATLSALETEGKAKVISAPRVIMQNNIEGEILQGTQIPYTTAQPGAAGEGGVISTFQVPTVAFKDAALKLTVKPRITSAGTVIMEVALERSAPNYTNALAGNPNPAIDTQKARTTVQVGDGATAAIGGIMFEDINDNDDRTPGLSRIPVIGRLLFHRTTKSTETRELVLLITPKIVKG